MSKPRPGNEQPPREDSESRGEELPAPNPPPARPPPALSINELQQITDDISRLTIVHEIVLNGDFKLQVASFSPKSLENIVKETLHRAFWDGLEEELSASPPDYTRAIQLLQEIKEALLSLLLPQHNQLQSQIEEALDMELIRQEAEHGALDIRGLTVEIFPVLDLMKMDMLNVTIQSLRIHLQDHTIQYEREKFQELLDKLPNCLDHTREWLCQVAAEVSVSSPQPPPHPAVSGSPAPRSLGADSRSTTVPSLRSVLDRGHMNLLCWEPGQKEYPETLFMDQAQLQEIQVQVNQLTIVAAVLLVTSGTCGSTLCGSPGFVARLKRVTKVLLEGLSCTRYEEALEDIGDQVLQEVSRTLSQLGYPAFPSDTRASLKGQIKNIADKGNAVRRVIVPQAAPTLQERLFPHGRLAFISYENKSSGFIPSSASSISPEGQNSPKDFPKGLDPIQEELLEVGRRFGRVIHHNRQVFGPYYSGILKKVLLPDAEPDSDSGMDSF